MNATTRFSIATIKQKDVFPQKRGKIYHMRINFVTEDVYPGVRVNFNLCFLLLKNPHKDYGSTNR